MALSTLVRALKAGRADNLFAAGGGELKRLAPGDGSEILPLIDLRLINDQCSPRLYDLAWPSRGPAGREWPRRTEGLQKRW